MMIMLEDMVRVADVRRDVGLVIEDLGGVLTRLREIEDGQRGAQLESSWSDVRAWLAEAGQRLIEAAEALQLEEENQ